MQHVPLAFGQDDAAVAAIGSQTRFDFDALLPTPLPGEFPPCVRQFDRVAITVPEPEREPFGEWLLRQSSRKDWIGDLAKAAKADRSFPKGGTVDDVRRRLQEQGADGDVHEALDDAELDWASF